MCCASAALPPLPQSKTLFPAPRVLHIKSPACSISPIFESINDWMASRCSRREWARKALVDFSVLMECSSTFESLPLLPHQNCVSKMGLESNIVCPQTVEAVLQGCAISMDY